MAMCRADAVALPGGTGDTSSWPIKLRSANLGLLCGSPLAIWHNLTARPRIRIRLFISLSSREVSP